MKIDAVRLRPSQMALAILQRSDTDVSIEDIPSMLSTYPYFGDSVLLEHPSDDRRHWWIPVAVGDVRDVPTFYPIEWIVIPDGTVEEALTIMDPTMNTEWIERKRRIFAEFGSFPAVLLDKWVAIKGVTGFRVH